MCIYMCVCVCVCVRERHKCWYGCLYMCTCLREREREETDLQTNAQTEKKKKLHAQSLQCHFIYLNMNIQDAYNDIF